MKLRELLQTEIWSKRTSRRIAVSLGMIFVVVVVWYEADRHWVTPSERKAGIRALTDVDRLQNFSGTNDQEYESGAEKAKDEITSAQDLAKTSRDEEIAELLSMYFMLTEVERSAQKSSFELSNSQNERFRKLSVRDPQLVRNSRVSRDFVSLNLHQVLK